MISNPPASTAAVRQTFSNAAVTVTVGTTVLAQTGTLSAARAITFPAASAYAEGTGFAVVDESGTITSTNKLTCTRAGSDTINGGATVDLITPYASPFFRSDGVSKWTMDVQGVTRGGTGSTDGSIAGTTTLTLASGGTNQPIVLVPIGSGTLQLRNGTTAQTLYVFGTFTDESNYERLAITATGITHQKAGTGNAQNIVLQSSYGGRISIGGSIQLAADTNPNGDNQYDLGTIGSGWRKLVFASTTTAAGTTGAQTINKTRGTVRFAAGASSLVVTNSLVSAASKIRAFPVSAFDATAINFTCSAASGSFTITANAAATAETEVCFDVVIY